VLNLKAKLKNKKEVAKGTMLFEYDLLGEEVNFRPGQYFFVTLKEGLEHHFTIVNSPNQKNILSHATRMRDTDFKNTLKDLDIETEVEVDRIGGQFVLPEDTSKSLVFIALGIGITPFVSMTRFIKDENLDFKMTLIYSDSDRESMAFLTELEHYSTDNPNFKIILTITKDENWTGEKRHVDGKFLEDYLDDPKEPIYYISGPPKAVEGVSNALVEAGISKENIKTENFSGY
jgi:ferredoxin-NADP reductase